MVKQRILLLPSRLCGHIPQQRFFFQATNTDVMYIFYYFGKDQQFVYSGRTAKQERQQKTWHGLGPALASAVGGGSGWEHVLSLCCSVLCVSKGNYLELSGMAVVVATECELNRKKCEQGSSQRRDEEEKTIKHRLGLGTCELQTGCVINGDCLCKHQM